MTQKIDYEDWINLYWDQITADYAEKYGEEVAENETWDTEQWESFLEDEYQDYCEAWEERIQDTMADEEFHSRQTDKFEDWMVREE